MIDGEEMRSWNCVPFETGSHLPPYGFMSKLQKGLSAETNLNNICDIL